MANRFDTIQPLDLSGINVYRPNIDQIYQYTQPLDQTIGGIKHTAQMVGNILEVDRNLANTYVAEKEAQINQALTDFNNSGPEAGIEGLNRIKREIYRDNEPNTGKMAILRERKQLLDQQKQYAREALEKYPDLIPGYLSSLERATQTLNLTQPGYQVAQTNVPTLYTETEDVEYLNDIVKNIAEDGSYFIQGVQSLGEVQRAFLYGDIDFKTYGKIINALSEQVGQDRLQSAQFASNAYGKQVDESDFVIRNAKGDVIGVNPNTRFGRIIDGIADGASFRDTSLNVRTFANKRAEFAMQKQFMNDYILRPGQLYAQANGLNADDLNPTNQPGFLDAILDPYEVGTRFDNPPPSMQETIGKLNERIESLQAEGNNEQANVLAFDKILYERVVKSEEDKLGKSLDQFTWDEYMNVVDNVHSFHDKAIASSVNQQDRSLAPASPRLMSELRKSVDNSVGTSVIMMGDVPYDYEEFLGEIDMTDAEFRKAFEPDGWSVGRSADGDPGVLQSMGVKVHFQDKDGKMRTARVIDPARSTPQSNAIGFIKDASVGQGLLSHGIIVDSDKGITMSTPQDASTVIQGTISPKGSFLFNEIQQIARNDVFSQGDNYDPSNPNHNARLKRYIDNSNIRVVGQPGYITDPTTGEKVFTKVAKLALVPKGTTNLDDAVFLKTTPAQIEGDFYNTFGVSEVKEQVQQGYIID